MLFRKIAYNSISISTPKNIIQYSFGLLLFAILSGSFQAAPAAIGLAGFVLAYSSVYMYNDIIDVDDDRKNEKKRQWKLIANGDLSIRGAKAAGLALLASGFALSLFVNALFIAALAAMLFLNFLYSSPYTRFKKGRNKTILNMGAIEFLKFSLGWFALDQTLAGFPFWIIMLFTISYVVGFVLYKFDLGREHVKRNKAVFIALGAACIASFALSFILYGIPLALVLAIALSTASVGLMKASGWSKRMRSMIAMEYVILAVVIISFALLLNPLAASANSQLAGLVKAVAGV